MKIKLNKKGQSMLEVIVALAIFALISASMISMSVGGLVALEQGGEHIEAEFLVQEAIEGLRSIRHKSWNEFIFTTSSISDTTEWNFDGEGTIEIIGQFTRVISFEDVCRDGSNNIVICPGTYTDPHTKKVKVIVNWEIRPGINNSIEREIYLTNWDSKDWTQTNWTSGDGQTIWFDEAMYDSDDGNLDVSTTGEVKLKEVAGGTTILDWGCANMLDNGDTTGNTNANAVYNDADYTYVVTGSNSGGPEFYIFDTSDLENIILLGSLETSGNLYDVYVSGNYAYVASNNNSGELTIIDITNKNIPNIVGMYNADSGADGRSVEGSGNIIYLSTSRNTSSGIDPEFYTIDISSSTNPVLLNALDITNDPNVYGLHIDGNYAYLATSGDTEELVIVDISNPSSLSEVGTYDSNGTSNAQRVFAKDGKAYLVKDTGDTEFEIIDVSTPSSPVQDSFIEFSNYLNDIWVDGNYAFVGSDENDKELVIIDISRSKAPFIVSEVDSNSDVNGIYIKDSIVYIANENNTQELQIYESSGGSWGCLKKVGIVDTPGTVNTYSIFTENNITYLGGFDTSDSSFYVYDTNAPSNPVELGSIALNVQIFDIYVSGDYAYLATNDNSQELMIIDISSPNNMSIVGSYDANGSQDAYGVYFRDNKLYLSSRSRSGPEFFIIDVSTPSTPTVLGGYESSGQSLRRFDIVGNYAYIASSNNNGEMLVLDISSSTNPLLEGTYDSVGSANGRSVVINGDYAYLTRYSGDSEFDIVDITDHSTMTTVGSLDLSGNVNHTYLNGNYAILGGDQNNSEIRVVDISDKTNPEVISNFDINGDVNRISSNGDKIYLSTEHDSEELVVLRKHSAGFIIDDSENAFDTGTYSNTEFDSGYLQLNATGLTNGSGDYTSYIFNASSSAPWLDIFWMPEAPYGKELPDNNINESAYTSDNANMSNNIMLFHMNESGGGGGGTTSSLINYTDDTQSEFNSGTYSDTQWDNTDTWVELDSTGLTNGSGDYESNTITGNDSNNEWNILSWIPERPYGKELPNSGNSETAYLNSNVNMTGNVLLMHLNESSGTNITDTSGNNNDGSLYGLGNYSINQSGKINKSIHFSNSSVTDDGQIRVPHDNSLNLGNSGTVCAWVNLDDYTQHYAGFVQKGGESSFSDSEYSLQIYSTNGRRPIFDVVDTSGSDRYVQSSINLNSGIWNHLCGTYSITSAIKIYVNGIERGSLSWNPSWSPRQATGPLLIGAQNTSNNEYGMNGYIDEVSVYNRELSVTEVLDHYHRGALDLKYQVRSCDDDACSGESFIGPDGTNVTYYSEANNSSINTPSFDLTNVDDNQYFQYKAFFETDNSLYSPELNSVSINTTEYVNAGGDEVTDTSGNNNNGANYVATYIDDGKFNKALSFDGINDYIEIDNEIISDYPFTISSWIKMDSIGSEDMVIMNLADSDVSNRYYGIYVGEDENGRVGIRGRNTAPRSVFSTTAVDDNEWHYIVGVFNSATDREIFVDGISENTDSSSVSFSTEVDKWEIGRWGDSTPKSYFEGNIDEVAVYSRSLSAVEILDNYLRGALNLKYQVRSCDDDACSGETFIGPDGTNLTYYSEVDNFSFSYPYFDLEHVSNNQYFQYKAYLTTDSTSYSPKVNTTTFRYTIPASSGGAGGYSTSGYLVSSAFNMLDNSPVQIIEWNENVSTCDPACDIELQIRTAPDSSGSPGTWTNWYGSTGVGTYFIDPFGILVDIALNNDQWVQYRVELSGDGTETPILEEIRVNYR